MLISLIFAGTGGNSQMTKTGQGRLNARPAERIFVDGPIGLHHLGINDIRDAVYYVHSNYHPHHPSPLAIMLHGAGATARQGLDLLMPYAEAAGIILLSPCSRESTWDLLAHRQYGQDIDSLNQALHLVFENYMIDKRHLAIGGFSDGASYALSVGILNGDLFTHCIGFSPGFAKMSGAAGLPEIFISHGTYDEVLPVKLCSRQIVLWLKEKGYHVEYHEFQGGHTVPPDIARESVEWFLAT